MQRKKGDGTQWGSTHAKEALTEKPVLGLSFSDISKKIPKDWRTALSHDAVAVTHKHTICAGIGLMLTIRQQEKNTHRPQLALLSVEKGWDKKWCVYVLPRPIRFN